MSIIELLAFIKQARINSKGVTAMEYGVIAAAIIVAIATALTTLSGKLTNTFNRVGSSLSS